ncbi:MAG: DUF4388 domain-containing protein [Blastochloris sp.]|nr:DUF4388 domain-containing protein [Blastochloris sp.]
MGLEGTLEDMPILDLLRVFQSDMRSGKLVLWNDIEWAIVWLTDGQAVSAVVLKKSDRRILQSGEEAIFRLFDWADGHFRYNPETSGKNDQITINRPTNFLIIDALWRHKRARKSPNSIELTIQTPLSVLPHMLKAREHIRLGMEEQMVLDCIGQQTTVQQVMDQTRLSQEQVLMIVAHLVDSSLIVAVPLIDLPQRRLTVTSPGSFADNAHAPTPITNLTRAIRRRLQQIALGA